MLDQLLYQIGLDRKESVVYLTCFSLGTQGATVIAKKTGLKRPTVHIVLQRLIQKGFVTVHFEKKTQQFTAVAPEKIAQHLENQKNRIETQKKLLENSIGEFEKLHSPYSLQPKVSFFSGIEGIINVTEDTLNSKTELLCYSSTDAWFSNEELKKYIIDYGKRRVQKYKIPLKSIETDSPVGRQYFEKDYKLGGELTQIRWLPKEILPFTNEINIYDNKLSICSLAEEELIGVIVESESITKTQRSIFELAWRSAKPSTPHKKSSSPV